MSVLVFQRRNRPRVLAFQRNFGVGVYWCFSVDNSFRSQDGAKNAPQKLQERFCKGITPAEGDSGPEKRT